MRPEYHGTGIRGAESKRRAAWPKHYQNRIYFGGPSYAEKEEGLGGAEHAVEVEPGVFQITDPVAFREELGEIISEKIYCAAETDSSEKENSAPPGT